jgi:hypothetical protein
VLRTVVISKFFMKYYLVECGGRSAVFLSSRCGKLRAEKRAAAMPILDVEKQTSPSGRQSYKHGRKE